MSKAAPDYADAFSLLKAGDPLSVEKALSFYRQAAEDRPGDMKALFEYAGAFDFLGREAEALPHYQAVLKGGYHHLPPEDQPRLFVQLGSTLRNLKKFSESTAVLREGAERFPAFTALKAFLALTLYSEGRNAEALQGLFAIILDDAPDESVRHYARALRWYADNIAEFPA